MLTDEELAEVDEALDAIEAGKAGIGVNALARFIMQAWNKKVCSSSLKAYAAARRANDGQEAR